MLSFLKFLAFLHHGGSLTDFDKIPNLCFIMMIQPIFVVDYWGARVFDLIPVYKMTWQILACKLLCYYSQRNI